MKKGIEQGIKQGIEQGLRQSIQEVLALRFDLGAVQSFAAGLGASTMCSASSSCIGQPYRCLALKSFAAC